MQLVSWLAFLSIVLLLILFIQAGSLVKKCYCKLLSHSCFQIPWLAGSLQRVTFLFVMSGKNWWVQREELPLSSHTDEGTDTDRCPCVISLCRNLSQPMAPLEQMAHEHNTWICIYVEKAGILLSCGQPLNLPVSPCTLTCTPTKSNK